MNEELTFNGQREKERVIEAKKNHPLTLLPSIFWAMLVWLAAVALMLFWGGAIAGWIAGLLVVVGIIMIIRLLYAYHNTVFLVTSERVINVVQKGFFNSSIVESEIGYVHNMVSNKSGVLRSMFDFGNLTIRISDDVKDREMIILGIPGPYETESTIASARSENKENSN